MVTHCMENDCITEMESQLSLDASKGFSYGRCRRCRCRHRHRQSPLAFLINGSPSKDKRATLCISQSSNVESSPFWRLISEPRLDE
ncbi:hypothetical protein M0804_002286 [Polistes exclamans]|nr:hypothetical protein M0804_002286 [Polistes exclamans]